MKKSNKQLIDSEDLLKDFDNILSLIDDINSKNIDELDLETLSSKSKKIKEETEKKYNPIIKKLKDNLDSLK